MFERGEKLKVKVEKLAFQGFGIAKPEKLRVPDPERGRDELKLKSPIAKKTSPMRCPNKLPPLPHIEPNHHVPIS